MKCGFIGRINRQTASVQFFSSFILHPSSFPTVKLAKSSRLLDASGGFPIPDGSEDAKRAVGSGRWDCRGEAMRKGRTRRSLP
jgi:hypothetical protein